MSRRPKLTLTSPLGGVSAASVRRVWRVYSMRLDTFIVAVKLDVGDRIPHGAKRKLDYHMTRLGFFLALRLSETTTLSWDEYGAKLAAERINDAWNAVTAYFFFLDASKARSLAAFTKLSYADDLLRYAVASYFKKRWPK
jgi:hypothetical protein